MRLQLDRSFVATVSSKDHDLNITTTIHGTNPTDAETRAAQRFRTDYGMTDVRVIVRAEMIGR
jgi:hypothetical protein